MSKKKVNSRTKRCTKCNTTKPLSEFYKQKTGKYGVRSNCKVCKKAYDEKNKESIAEYKRNHYQINKEDLLEKNKVYRENNKESIAENKRSYYNLNKDAILEYQNFYREKNKESIAEYKRNHYQINKDVILEYIREYKRNNPDKVREHTARRRAKKMGVNENYSQDKRQIVEITFDNKCFNCGSKEMLQHDHHYCLNDGYALDIGNAVLLCRFCNCSKHTKDPADFYKEDQLKDLEVLFKVQQDLYTLSQIENNL